MVFLKNKIRGKYINKAHHNIEVEHNNEDMLFWKKLHI